jgi:putative oxidoreductase
MKFLLKTGNDFGATLARLTLGGVMYPHGAQKALGMYGGQGIKGTVEMFGNMGISAPLAYCAIAAEFLGAIALLVGFLGRLGALGIGITMAYAIHKVHGANGFFLSNSGYEYNAALIGLSLVVLVKGSGAASLDRMLVKPG